MIDQTIRFTSYTTRLLQIYEKRIARFRYSSFDTQVIEIDFASNELINTRHLV